MTRSLRHCASPRCHTFNRCSPRRALGSMVSATTEPHIREYQPDRDREAVLDICRDVYGGRDYIPRVIDSYGSDTDVLVETPSTSGTPRALLCGARDGSLYHIWGARTHPNARGQGIMRRMIQYVGSKANATLISTTIRSNTSMLRLFESEGYEEHENEIHLWPDSSVMDEERCTMDFVLSHHAGALEERRQRCGGLSPCSSMEELRRGLVRARGTHHDGWMPASYEVVSSDGRVMREAMAGGDVFVSEDLNAVVAIFIDQLGGTVLSIVCTASLLSDVLSLVHNKLHGRSIKRMYVDLCGTDLSTAGFVHGHEKGWTSYVVLTKHSKHDTS